MPTDDTSQIGWPLHVYRVRDEARQQSILRAFRRIAYPGVTALGSRSGPECFVIAECRSFGDQIRARRVIRIVDPDAERDRICELSPEEVRTRRG
ncbi:MAG: hypothetical protein JWQ91_1831 [Aeromicrobium sp.]|jgi:hypothetical protein|uniref:hypothetical protein n=1 Tax=Aeromicrobium sp. TaxID=1871063 RepID=UPI0026088F53|nr:hypothetical protein [Aeromicrobium sp.]MCW2824914.1 hypothetical protein [Aeromicrobium sp.]